MKQFLRKIKEQINIANKFLVIMCHIPGSTFVYNCSIIISKSLNLLKG